MSASSQKRDAGRKLIENSNGLILELIAPSNAIFTYYKSKAD